MEPSRSPRPRAPYRNERSPNTLHGMGTQHCPVIVKNRSLQGLPGAVSRPDTAYTATSTPLTTHSTTCRPGPDQGPCLCTQAEVCLPKAPWPRPPTSKLMALARPPAHLYTHAVPVQQGPPKIVVCSGFARPLGTGMEAWTPYLAAPLTAARVGLLWSQTAHV